MPIKKEIIKEYSVLYTDWIPVNKRNRLVEKIDKNKKLVFETSLDKYKESILGEIEKEIAEEQKRVLIMNIQPSIVNKEAQLWYSLCGSIFSNLIKKISQLKP